MIAQGGHLTCGGMTSATTMSEADTCSYLPASMVMELAATATDVRLAVGGSSTELGDWTDCFGGDPCVVTSTNSLGIEALRSPTENWENGATWSGWNWSSSGGWATGWPNMHQASGVGDGVHWIADEVPYYSHSNNGNGAPAATNLLSATFVR